MNFFNAKSKKKCSSRVINNRRKIRNYSLKTHNNEAECLTQSDENLLNSQLKKNFKIINNENDEKEKIQNNYFTKENENLNDNYINKNDNNKTYKDPKSSNINNINNASNFNNFFNIQIKNYESYLTIAEEIKKSLFEEWKNKLQVSQSEVFSVSAAAKIDIDKKNRRGASLKKDSKSNLIINAQKKVSLDNLNELSEAHVKKKINVNNNNSSNNINGNNNLENNKNIPFLNIMKIENKPDSSTADKLNSIENTNNSSIHNNKSSKTIIYTNNKSSKILKSLKNSELNPIQNHDQNLNGIPRINSSTNKLKNSDALAFLVIDDNLYIRESVRRLLQMSLKNLLKKDLVKKDFQIFEGADGIDALKLLIDPVIGSRVRGMFIDENMEYLNGSETIRIVRKFQSLNKIQKFNIATVTAFEDSVTRSVILQAGVDEILPKPLSKNNVEDFFKKYPINE